MSTMTRVQAEALAAFITRLRTDWRPAGVIAALEKAAPNADAYDVARALINLAAEPSVQTPGLLAGPGPHWRRPDGEIPARRGDHDVHCHKHPLSVMPNCPQCRAEDEPCPPDPIRNADYLDWKKKLAARKTASRPFKPSPLTDTGSADRARDRIKEQG